MQFYVGWCRAALIVVAMCVACLAAMAGRAEAEPVIATWYGAELAGSPMANGEPFSPGGFTVAHPFLPLGTPVRLCLEGLCADAVVTDRGPLLDASAGVAEAIGLKERGVGTVDLQVL